MTRRQRRALPSPAGDDGQLEMTPMIDVTFLLLVFFLCTLQFRALEGKLAAYLPKDQGAAVTDATPAETLTVRVAVLEPGTRLGPARDGRRAPAWDGSGRFQFASDRVLEYRVGPRRTRGLAELAARLTELYAAAPERPVELSVGSEVVHVEVVEVLDAALGAGFRDVRFGASRP